MGADASSVHTMPTNALTKGNDTMTTTTRSVLPAKSAMAAYVSERTQHKAAPAEENGVRAESPAAAATAPRRAISEREKQLLRLVCEGQTNREMATNLGISTETVKSELKRIFRKIDVRNRTQAAVVLVRQGLD